MGLNKEDIKALISILQKGLIDDDEPQQKTTRKTKKKTTKPKASNKFDEMPEYNMCKEDLEFDRKVKKPPPSARNRNFDYMNVQCRVCGKQEKVPPTLVESRERYKCNKCSTGAG